MAGQYRALRVAQAALLPVERADNRRLREAIHNDPPGEAGVKFNKEETH